MKKFVISALALTAASVALPAAAQSYHAPNRGPTYHAPAYQAPYRPVQNYGPGYNNGPNYNGWETISRRQARLDQRIDNGVRNGQLSRREATRLRSEFGALVRLEGSYRRTNGLSQWERQDLDRRYDRLAYQIRLERRDDDNRRF
jgi:hypothetical protein